MRKTILKALIAIFAVSLIMTSCLGDNDSNITNSNALAYVKRGEVRNIANAGNITFSHDYVNRLTPGFFYRLDYEVVSKDGQNQDGSYIARSVSGTGQSLSEGSFDYSPTPPKDPEIYPTQINISYLFSPRTIDFEDNWAFSYDCMINELDVDPTADSRTNIKLVAAIFDEDQFTGPKESPTPLADNKVIVRLYLERIEPSRPTSKEKVRHVGESQLNLREVRNHFQGKLAGISKDGSVGIIQFKYMFENKEGSDPKYKEIGNLSEERPDFGMIIEN